MDDWRECVKIKNGKVWQNEYLHDTYSVEIYFTKNAAFTEIDNWEDIFKNLFKDYLSKLDEKYDKAFGNSTLSNIFDENKVPQFYVKNYQREINRMKDIYKQNQLLIEQDPNLILDGSINNYINKNNNNKNNNQQQLDSTPEDNEKTKEQLIKKRLNKVLEIKINQEEIQNLEKNVKNEKDMVNQFKFISNTLRPKLQNIEPTYTTEILNELSKISINELMNCIKDNNNNKLIITLQTLLKSILQKQITIINVDDKLNDKLNDKQEIDTEREESKIDTEMTNINEQNIQKVNNIPHRFMGKMKGFNTFYLANFDKFASDEEKVQENENYNLQNAKKKEILDDITHLLDTNQDFTPDCELEIFKPNQDKYIQLTLNIKLNKLNDYGDQKLLTEKLLLWFDKYNKINNNNHKIPIDDIVAIHRNLKKRNQIQYNLYKQYGINNINSVNYDEFIDGGKNNFEKQRRSRCIYKDEIFIILKNTNINEIPDVLNFSLEKFEIEKKNINKNDIEKNIDILYNIRCRICGSPYCKQGRCPEYMNTIKEFEREFPTAINVRKKIGQMCIKCGKNGGHGGKPCKSRLYCKWCDTYDDHNSLPNYRCPYFNGIGICMRLLKTPFLENQRRNEKINNKLKHPNKKKWTIDMKWKPEVTSRNKEIFDSVIQQFKLIKYELLMEDNFGNFEKGVMLNEKIDYIKNQERKTFLNFIKTKRNNLNKEKLSEINKAIGIMRQYRSQNNKCNNKECNHEQNHHQNNNDIPELTEEVLNIHNNNENNNDNNDSKDNSSNKSDSTNYDNYSIPTIDITASDISSNVWDDENNKCLKIKYSTLMEQHTNYTLENKTESEIKGMLLYAKKLDRKQEWMKNGYNKQKRIYKKKLKKKDMSMGSSNDNDENNNNKNKIEILTNHRRIITKLLNEINEAIILNDNENNNDNDIVEKVAEIIAKDKQNAKNKIRYHMIDIRNALHKLIDKDLDIIYHLLNYDIGKTGIERTDYQEWFTNNINVFGSNCDITLSNWILYLLDDNTKKLNDRKIKSRLFKLIKEMEECIYNIYGQNKNVLNQKMISLICSKIIIKNRISLENIKFEGKNEIFNALKILMKNEILNKLLLINSDRNWGSEKNLNKLANELIEQRKSLWLTKEDLENAIISITNYEKQKRKEIEKKKKEKEKEKLKEKEKTKEKEKKDTQAENNNKIKRKRNKNKNKKDENKELLKQIENENVIGEFSNDKESIKKYINQLKKQITNDKNNQVENIKSVVKNNLKVLNLTLDVNSIDRITKHISIQKTKEKYEMLASKIEFNNILKLFDLDNNLDDNNNNNIDNDINMNENNKKNNNIKNDSNIQQPIFAMPKLNLTQENSSPNSIATTIVLNEEDGEDELSDNDGAKSMSTLIREDNDVHIKGLTNAAIETNEAINHSKNKPANPIDRGAKNINNNNNIIGDNQVGKPWNLSTDTQQNIQDLNLSQFEIDTSMTGDTNPSMTQINNNENIVNELDRGKKENKDRHDRIRIEIETTGNEPTSSVIKDNYAAVENNSIINNNNDRIQQ